MLYRATYLHDRHVHDGLHSLDAAHGRLGHGAREIHRSVALAGEKTERGVSGYRARLERRGRDFRSDAAVREGRCHSRDEVRVVAGKAPR